MKTRLPERTIFRTSKPLAAKPSLKSGEGLKMEKAVTIARPANEVYSFWRRLENLARFMPHVVSVTESGDGISHWVIKTQNGKQLEWDARFIEDKPDQMISWQSLEGADVDNAGSVWFTNAAGGRGTVVKVSIKYSPVGGKFGAALAKIFGDSAVAQLAEDLFRLKSLLETGEIPTCAGQPRGGSK
jgi:uncharacterized membrane protein